ncbi:MAG: nuclear transport factor 2 family protein [Mycobacterium sp.]
MTLETVASGQTSGTTETPEEVVRNFYRLWDEVGFKKAYIRYLHPEVFQENTARPSRAGKDVVLASLDSYLEIYLRPFASVNLLNIAVAGNVVFTERVEHCYSPDHDDTHDGHFASIFVIEDGLIRRWAEFWGDDPRVYSFGEGVPKPSTYRRVAELELAAAKA